jgi:RES domain-containing protein
LSFTAWRITKRKHVKTAFSGSGARKYGGRWNSPGSAVVYSAQTQSLAVLEMLVHMDGPELLQRYVLLGVELEESLVREVGLADLPRNWRADPAPIGLRKIGDEWIAIGASPVLRVPSTLVPAESNFLLNPAHPEFEKLIIGEPIAFDFDQRLAKSQQAHR